MTIKTHLGNFTRMAAASSSLLLAACTGDGDSEFMSSAPSASIYVERAAMSDMFEIESSRIALDRAQNTAVRDFAQQMVSDHSNTSSNLKSATTGDAQAAMLPDALDSAHQQKIQQLESAGSDDFDRLYVDMQVEGHEEALALHRLYSDDGEDPELQRVATAAVPVVTHHLEEIEQISANLE